VNCYLLTISLTYPWPAIENGRSKKLIAYFGFRGISFLGPYFTITG
jgi:hypothetical protein